MRFFGLAVATSAALVLGACGGGDKAKTDTTGAMAPAATATTPAATPTAGAPAPITGQTVEVKMIGDEKGYRYEPADITIKQGDGIKFIMVSGGPHNVSFDPATIPAAAKTQLEANITDPIGDLSGKLLMAPNESYILSFAGVPPGKYEFHCTPHIAMNMKGTITIQ
jgi:plastocyanin